MGILNLGSEIKKNTITGRFVGFQETQEPRYLFKYTG